MNYLPPLKQSTKSTHFKQSTTKSTHLPVKQQKPSLPPFLLVSERHRRPHIACRWCVTDAKNVRLSHHPSRARAGSRGREKRAARPLLRPHSPSASISSVSSEGASLIVVAIMFWLKRTRVRKGHLLEAVGHSFNLMGLLLIYLRTDTCWHPLLVKMFTTSMSTDAQRML